MFTITKIFYSLNCQDIPEFFEDHQEEFMTLLHKYLVYFNPLLETEVIYIYIYIYFII